MSSTGTVAASTRQRHSAPIVGAAAVAAVSLGGAAFSVAAGLSPDLAAALGPTARLAVPLPMLAALLVLAVLSTVRRRPIATTAAALLGVAGAICVISGFFDGGYSDDRLTGGQRTYQGLLILALAACSTLAFARLRRLLRRHG